VYLDEEEDVKGKTDSLRAVRKEWNAPTYKCFGNVKDLTLKTGNGEPIDPNTGRPMGASAGIKCIS